MPNRAGLSLVASVTRDHVTTAVATRAEVPAVALDAAGDWLRDRQRRAFRTAGFGQWAPDDAATVKIKGGARVLVDRGHLLDSLTDPRARGARHETTRDSVMVATDLVQGIMAQHGRHQAVRNPSPPLSRAETSEVSRRLLGAIVDGA